MNEQLRYVQLGDTGYRLRVYATAQSDRRGQTYLAYEFFAPGAEEPLFSGSDFAGSPLHSDDSDETLRCLLGFLTLRPGDTDKEYFQHYTAEQLAYCSSDAEYLGLWAFDEPDTRPPLLDIREDGVVSPEWPHITAIISALAPIENELEDELDVRLQVTSDGWLVHTGDASYDTDHHGWWGASSLNDESDLEEVAKDLLSQVKDAWWEDSGNEQK